MPVGENAEDRARNAINAKDPKQGQEMQQVQALQSSIQEIQGERRNNLMAARVGAEGDARENQAMLQAAEMGMLGGVGAVAVEMRHQYNKLHHKHKQFLVNMELENLRIRLPQQEVYNKLLLR